MDISKSIIKSTTRIMYKLYYFSYIQNPSGVKLSQHGVPVVCIIQIVFAPLTSWELLRIASCRFLRKMFGIAGCWVYLTNHFNPNYLVNTSGFPVSFNGLKHVVQNLFSDFRRRFVTSHNYKTDSSVCKANKKIIFHYDKSRSRSINITV